MKLTRQRLWLTAAIVLAGSAYAAYSLMSDPFANGPPLTAPLDGSLEIPLLDRDFRVDPLAEGWGHRTFFGVSPTEYSIRTEGGKPVLQCATDNSGSILARHTAIDIGQYPILSWRWKIDRPIESEFDEDTEEGDDHPARFFLRFEEDGGKTRTTEIIWSNRKYEPGDYKIIGNFHHYVANGLRENLGIWQGQRVDLMRLYKDIGGASAAPQLSVLGFFCDSDNTGAQSLASFADIKLEKR